MNNFLNKFILIAFFLFCGLNHCFPQIQMIDERSKDPIPFVEIYTNEGVYLGNADDKGIITIAILEKIRQEKSSSILVFNQIAYEKVAILGKDILNLKYISLLPKPIELNEVIIVPPKSETTIVLTGYYRSYQLKGDQLEYFSDGKVELAYIPNNTKALNKRLSERSWFNPKIESEGNFIINMVGPPVPDFQTIEDINEVKKNNVYTLLQSDKNKSITIIEVLKNDKENVKTIKALGNKSIINLHKEKYAFKTVRSENTNVKHLDYYSINKNLMFKCKDCSDFENYYMQSEIFITDIQYFDTFNTKTYSKFTGNPKNSHYTENYWSDVEKHRLFQPLNEKVKTELLKLTLKPIK